MRRRLKTESGKAIYKLRQQTVEPVFGIIKSAMGFRQFLLRGLEKVSLEWELVCLAYNFRRLHTLAGGDARHGHRGGPPACIVCPRDASAARLEQDRVRRSRRTRSGRAPPARRGTSG